MGLDPGNPGQTPLDEDEKDGLLIETVSTRGELDEFEQKNIEKAVQWTISKTFKVDTILTEQFVKEVHSRMFNEVWGWAGEFRHTNKNIGVDWTRIAMHLKQILDNTRFWIQHRTFSEDEVAIRLSHGLVQVHPFPNGNGRHSRLCADILVAHVYDKEPFAWGGAVRLSTEGEMRRRYLDGIRKADNGDWTDLMKFARSGGR